MGIKNEKTFHQKDGSGVKFAACERKLMPETSFTYFIVRPNIYREHFSPCGLLKDLANDDTSANFCVDVA